MSFRLVEHFSISICQAWYLLFKYVLIRFPVIRALFQLNNDQTTSDRQENQRSSRHAVHRRQTVRRE